MRNNLVMFNTVYEIAVADSLKEQAKMHDYIQEHRKLGKIIK